MLACIPVPVSMKVIHFLRSFSTTRVIKGKFRLSGADGGGTHGFAYGQRDNHFQKGQKVAVQTIKQGSMLVVANNPLTGEVVLDGAKEGVDFEVASNEALPESH